MRIWLISIFMLFAHTAWSAQVLKIKGNKALLDNSDQSLYKGSEYNTINRQGQNSAVIQIQALKGNRAIGIITRGKTAPGQELRARTENSFDYKTAAAPTSNQSPAIRSHYGLLAGLNYSQMKVSFTDGDSVSMTGNGLTFRGFYQMPVLSSVMARIALGYVPLTAKGTASAAACGTTTLTADCSTNINYLEVEGMAQYNLSEQSSRFWLGIGFSFLSALSKSSNAINESKVSSNQMILFALGYDYTLSSTMYIPINFEYGYFPSSTSGVTASMMLINTGLGMSF